MLRLQINSTVVLAAALILSACSTSKTRPPPQAPQDVPVATPVMIEAEPVAESATPPVESISPWQVLRERLQPRNCQAQASVLAEQRQFLRNPEAFQSAWRDAMPFFLFVMNHIERRDLPGEIALIPFIESRYRPLPGSGQGAAGMWQLVPGTAKAHGLEVSGKRDARHDTIESTRAALNLLEHLEREFSDWRLAYLAYNAGEFRIKRALGKRSSWQETQPPFERLKLSPTNRQFLSRIDALACIIRRPDLHGLDFPEPTSGDTLEAVQLGQPVDIQLVSALSTVPIETLLRFNSGRKQRKTILLGPQEILIPSASRAGFEQGLAMIPMQMRAHWKRIRIGADTSLDSLASNMNVPVEMLANANPGAGNDILEAGEILLIPDSDSTSPELPREQSQAVHVVRQGDSLWRLARMHGVSVEELRAWNDLHAGSILKLGMRLLIRAPEY